MIVAPARTPDRSHAVPTPQPVPNSAIVPWRVAASAASNRPVSLRQKDTYPARRDTSKARATIGGRSGGALMFRVCQTGPGSPCSGGKSRIVGHVAAFHGARRRTDLPSFHHAEELRTHLPPWRGLLSRATSPRSSAFPPPGPTKPSASEQVKSHPHASLSSSSITSRVLAETVWSKPLQPERRTAMYEMYPE